MEHCNCGSTCRVKRQLNAGIVCAILLLLVFSLRQELKFFDAQSLAEKNKRLARDNPFRLS